jgi:hypothetical protein
MEVLQTSALPLGYGAERTTSTIYDATRYRRASHPATGSLTQ